jgi:hypothetical protein
MPRGVMPSGWIECRGKIGMKRPHFAEKIHFEQTVSQRRGNTRNYAFTAEIQLIYRQFSADFNAPA